METQTHVKAGGSMNHNETLVRDTGTAKGLQVKSHVKAGGVINHNETLARDRGRGPGLKVRTRIKAGYPPGPSRS
jgi:hypothetical protein